MKYLVFRVCIRPVTTDHFSTRVAAVFGSAKVF